MAKGSHVTYGGWEEKNCATCGERTTLDSLRPAIYMRHGPDGNPVTYHADGCLPRANKKGVPGGSPGTPSAA